MSKRTPPKTQAAGFALLMTLIVLAIVASVLVGVARTSARHAVEAAKATMELQRRWGAVSIEKAFLPRVEQMIGNAEATAGAPLPTVRRSLVLGSQKFELVFTDEQARVNLNTLLFQRDQHGVDAAAHAAVDSVSNSVRVEVDPTVSATDAGRADRTSLGKDLNRFGSWSQIYPDAGPGTLLGDPEEIDGPVSQLTCWGDGRINFRRASVKVLTQGLSPEIGSAQATQIRYWTQRFHGMDQNKLLDMLHADGAVQAKLADATTAESHCHGLWIVSRAGSSTFYRFCVYEELQLGVVKIHRMEW